MMKVAQYTLLQLVFLPMPTYTWKSAYLVSTSRMECKGQSSQFNSSYTCPSSIDHGGAR